jgi:DNA-binding NarL/FixJ family response regulator
VERDRLGGKPVHTQRILIVDDHAGARAALHAIVADEADMEVVGEAANGIEAIQAVGQLAPDLVLMDVTMPRMNGIEATAEIKRCYPGVRILIVTLHNNDEYARASTNAGADGFVLKDVGREQFRIAMRATH